MRFLLYRLTTWVAACFLCVFSVCGESLRIATYNLDNYLVMARYVNGAWHKSYPKPEAEKVIIRSVIREKMPEILALQEMGSLPFLKELQADLAAEGVDYPYAIHMQGADSVRHLAVAFKTETG